MFRFTDGYFGWCVTAMLAVGVAVAQPAPSDTDESAYAPATLARIMGGAARAQNDEAELGAAGQWFTTTATFTGRKRPISGRYRPIIGAWLSGRGEGQDVVEMYFAGELKEVEFEQGGKKHWVLAGLPGGLGFDVYPPGQKLSIYLQRIGFASGAPVAVMTIVKLPGGATSATVRSGRRMRNARVGEGARRQETVYRNGTATFTYAGREYTLPLDPAGRHSIAPGIYSYENGVRTALLEYGAGDDRYLLLRVPAGDEASDVVPYLVLNGRIVPPIDISGCNVDVEPVQKTGARGVVDCSASQRAVLSKLRFSAD
ncbi:MAG: hypothetical protein H7Y89_10855 [Steroidobacteraceae bacterium]|nr:hypothetical protein [Steroidobacteraceae bacterium]